MKPRRALLFTTTAALLLCAACGVWLHVQKQRYARSRELIAALIRNDTKTALVLVNAGADPNTRYQPTPAPTLPQLLKQLLHRLPPPVNDTPTAFQIACGRREIPLGVGETLSVTVKEDLPLVRAMLSRGADVNAKTVEEDTALHDAVLRRRLPTVELLLRHGANVNAQDTGRRTPLMYAAANDSAAMVHLLLSRGADPNVPNAYGETALYSAFFGHDPKNIIPDLLAHGADPDVADTGGVTALEWAHRLGRADFVRLLTRRAR